MEERNQEVIKKAFELFGQYGIKSVSMDDIARELAISKKTLYNLVKDKNSLVMDVIDYMRDIFKESLEVFHNEKYNAIEQFFQMGQSMDATFGSIQPAFVRDLQKYHPEASRIVVEEKKEIQEAAFLANVQHGQAAGIYQEDVDGEIVARILLTLQLHLLGPMLKNEAATEMVFRKEGLHREVLKYHFRAICTPKGMEELKRQGEKWQRECNC
ncbi:MAG: TetR/AcrR family transcriptional regulator [Mangrovibacterium sp.]